MAPGLTWNVILVGEQNVGKTSMSFRFVRNTFMERYNATVAVDHISKMLQIHDTDINLQIWDSAGQEVYRSIVPQYFRVAEGCILVYDVNNITSFHKLSGWLSEFRTFNEKAPVIIVGNKNEDPTCKAVNRSIIKSFAEQEEMTFMECSAKNGDNVDKVFECLVQKIWENTYPETVQKNTNEKNNSICEMPNEPEKSDMFNKKPMKSGKSSIQKFEQEKTIHLSKTLSKPKKKNCSC